MPLLGIVVMALAVLSSALPGRAGAIRNMDEEGKKIMRRKDPRTHNLGMGSSLMTRWLLALLLANGARIGSQATPGKLTRAERGH